MGWRTEALDNKLLVDSWSRELVQEDDGRAVAICCEDALAKLLKQAIEIDLPSYASPFGKRSRSLLARAD